MQVTWIYTRGPGPIIVRSESKNEHTQVEGCDRAIQPPGNRLVRLIVRAVTRVLGAHCSHRSVPFGLIFLFDLSQVYNARWWTPLQVARVLQTCAGEAVNDFNVFPRSVHLYTSSHAFEAVASVLPP